MTKAMINTDAMLTEMVAAAVKQGENLRVNVRNLTLQALQARDLSLGQMRAVLTSVTAGVNRGAADTEGDPQKMIGKALAGMDEALLQAVRASHIALNQLSEQGADFEDSRLKKSLNELERLEDEFLKVVQQAAGSSTGSLKNGWTQMLQQARADGTETGAEVEAMFSDMTANLQKTMRSGREATFKAAHAFTQNFATLASGILIGLTEAYQRKPAASAPSPAPAKTASKRSR
ncbi:MAG TPA: DUF6781 family protein [Burkholderiaceae bacterium]|jgi:hypothetical protein|nr:DUF6781 family protein [Burkholderiaceae bacterium]